eukprot:TRINITY_DN7429_c0_g2_i3.p1 TRINITY_DN7429_c0_g2~~TRINITY_DN7429_c0_g2_i3.p1  ORF type:complete len:249 (+),score=22.00 TRINITY_DN7429_c0_g2_i3:91-747(+)
MAKHRKFDNPHAVQGGKRGKHDRGWATGTVGWGVQGYFGGDEPDDKPKVTRPGKMELVKDKYGRWINPNKKNKKKSKDEADAAQATNEEPSSSLLDERRHREDLDEFGRKIPRSSRRDDDRYDRRGRRDRDDDRRDRRDRDSDRYRRDERDRRDDRHSDRREDERGGSHRGSSRDRYGDRERSDDRRDPREDPSSRKESGEAPKKRKKKWDKEWGVWR